MPRAKAQLRAVALQLLGDAYMSVRKDEDEAQEESEYVRIETKNSRKRDSFRPPSTPGASTSAGSSMP